MAETLIGFLEYEWNLLFFFPKNSALELLGKKEQQTLNWSDLLLEKNNNIKEYSLVPVQT